MQRSVRLTHTSSFYAASHKNALYLFIPSFQHIQSVQHLFYRIFRIRTRNFSLLVAPIRTKSSTLGIDVFWSVRIFSWAGHAQFLHSLKMWLSFRGHAVANDATVHCKFCSDKNKRTLCMWLGSGTSPNPQERHRLAFHLDWVDTTSLQRTAPSHIV